MESIDVHHEIACMLELASASREDVVEHYGAEVVEAGIRDIEFMCKCLRAEREAMSRHSCLYESARRKTGICVKSLSSELDYLQLFLLYCERWYPDNLTHLLYLKWRNSACPEQYEYAEELVKMIQVAEANDAFESVLSGASSARVLDTNGLEL